MGDLERRTPIEGSPRARRRTIVCRRWSKTSPRMRRRRATARLRARARRTAASRASASRPAAFARSSSSFRSPSTSIGSTTSARTSIRARRSSPCSATPPSSGPRTTTSSFSCCIRRIASAFSPLITARIRRASRSSSSTAFARGTVATCGCRTRLASSRTEASSSSRATSSTSLPGARLRSSSATRPSTTRSPGSRIARCSRTASSTRSSCAASRLGPRSPSSSSTWTISRASTTRWVTPPVTRCCAASGFASARRSRPATRSRGWEATSSRS